MNTAGCCQNIRLFDQAFVLSKTATGVLRSLWAEIPGNKDQYVNKMSSDMSKSIFLKNSLHDHVIIVILIPASSDCTRWKHSH